LYNNEVRIAPSARKHGIADEDIIHASAHVLGFDDVSEDHLPPRTLIIGPSRTGVLLELVILHLDDGDVTLHAMPMRPKYNHLLGWSD
jgi:hypothetical protein